MECEKTFAGVAEALSHLLWAASVRLDQVTANGKYDRVFFLSREGLALFHAHRALYKRQVRQPMSYLFASRRNLGLATCWNIDDCYRMLDTPFHPQPLGRLMSNRFGLSPFGWEEGNVVVSRHEKALIKRHLKQRSIEVLSRASNERDSYLAYLDYRGLNAGGRYLLVDIGYNGTYQRAFQRLVPSARFESFCLAAFSGAVSLVRDGQMHTLLEGVRDNRLRRDPFSRNVACVELLLMARHPSFIAVSDLDGGRFTYHFDHLGFAAPREITRIQSEAFALLRRDDRARTLEGVRTSVATFESWLGAPSVADVMALSHLKLDDRFGGKELRPLIARDVPADNAVVPFDTAVTFYDESEWKDGALAILRRRLVDAPLRATAVRKKGAWHRKFHKLFRSREAFRHHIKVFILKRLGRYKSPVLTKHVIAEIVTRRFLQ